MGRTFLYVIAGTTTYGYCIEEKAWHEVSSQTALWHKQAGISSGGSFVTYAISTVSTAGKLYVVNPANFVFQDDSFAYTASFQTSLLDFGDEKRKTMMELEIVGDRTTAASTLSISFSDDDYQTFSTARTVDLSSSRRRITRCGTFRRRSIKISHSANTSMRLQAFDVSVTKGRT
jgi:hypothetical protein